jgi:hypothetical protein
MPNFSYQNMRDAYKNNYATYGSHLSPTCPLTQNKAMHTTNVERATLDLELCIYI